MDTIALDTFRYAGTYSRRATVRLMRRHRTFLPVATMRWWQAARNRVSRRLASAVHHYACTRAAMDLPIDARIGAGFLICHGWGLVINAGAELGQNVTVMHGVTIGQGDVISEGGNRETGYPVIEDDVWIGPNATIVGGVRVGKGARILAGAVVFFDVPAGTMVAGNPGKIIRENVPEDVVNKPTLRVPKLGSLSPS